MSHTGPQVGDCFADVVDIRGSNSNSPATSLKNEIVECLARNEINILKEHGMPDITWSKSLPTSELLFYLCESRPSDAFLLSSGVVCCFFASATMQSSLSLNRYEGQGLDLYEDITNYTPYYLYNDELSILRKYGKDIVCISLILYSPHLNINVPGHTFTELSTTPEYRHPSES